MVRLGEHHTSLYKINPVYHEEEEPGLHQQEEKGKGKGKGKEEGEEGEEEEPEQEEEDQDENAMDVDKEPEERDVSDEEMDADDSPHHRRNSGEPSRKRIRSNDAATENPDGGDRSPSEDEPDEREGVVRSFRELEDDKSEEDVDQLQSSEDEVRPRKVRRPLFSLITCIYLLSKENTETQEIWSAASCQC
jgi:hypothetical protein